MQSLHSTTLEHIRNVFFGVEFDPERHEAIMHEAKDELETTIVDEIMRSGYLWKGRTIRPAMVRTIGPT